MDDRTRAACLLIAAMSLAVIVLSVLRHRRREKRRYVRDDLIDINRLGGPQA